MGLLNINNVTKALFLLRGLILKSFSKKTLGIAQLLLSISKVSLGENLNIN